jgi:hypothetical protein
LRRRLSRRRESCKKKTRDNTHGPPTIAL